jgi:pimeloyl-ACP methyl ester carboxylesterase
VLDDAFADGIQRIYVDLPGYGHTPSLSAPGGLPELVDWFAATIDDLVGSATPYALLGNSMGGVLARDALSRDPRRVLGMALIAPVVDPVYAHRTLAQHVVANPNPDLTASLPQDKAMDFLQMGVNQSFAAWRRYQRFILPGTAACDREANERLSDRYWLATEPESRFDTYNGPTLIITGKQDQIVGYEDQRALLPHYPNAEYHIVDPAGHNIHIDNPEVVKPLVRQWTEKLAGPRT